MQNKIIMGKGESEWLLEKKLSMCRGKKMNMEKVTGENCIRLGLKLLRNRGIKNWPKVLNTSCNTSLSSSLFGNLFGAFK